MMGQFQNRWLIKSLLERGLTRGTLRETTDKGTLSERQLTRGHFWRDDWQGGTLRGANNQKRGNFGEIQQYQYSPFDGVAAAC